jgi:phosphate/sulfate permease
MLNNPLMSRAFAFILLTLGLYLALENTLISASVLQMSSGATMVTAFAVAVVATGLELAFASWLRQEKTFPALVKEFQGKPVHTSFRLFGSGLGLAIVYHFDLLTTARHPSFADSDNYFFGVIVLALVFGPEVCIVIASWLLISARDVESRQLDKNTTKDAENRRLKTKREKLISIADEVGKAEAIETARKRWGGVQEENRL